MPLLPGVTFEIQDNGLGITSANGDRAQVKIGICSGGTPNVLQSFGSVSALVAALGEGPMVNAAATCLEVAGGLVHCVPVDIAINDGYTYLSQTTSHVGTGSGTLSLSLAPVQSISLKIITSTTFTYQLGSGAVSNPITKASSVRIPGTLTVIGMSGSFTSNDTYVIGVDGTVTASMGATGTVTQKSLPQDNYEVQISINTSASAGTAKFSFSLDAGVDSSASVLTSTSGYQLPNTGIVVAFTGSFVAGDVYSFNSCQGDLNGTNLTAALQALSNSYLSTKYALIHVVGNQHNATSARSLAGSADTEMTTLESDFKFARCLIECPTVGPTSGVSGSLVLTTDGYAQIDTNSSDTDAVLDSDTGAFFSFVSTRVGVCAGEEKIVSAVDGLTYRRNIANSCAARLSAVNPATDGSAFRLGALASVVSLLRDEAQTPGLDAARFITARTYTGQPGLYLTNVKTMDLETGDQARMANARVLDEACTIVYGQALQYVNASIPVKSDGTILPKAAAQIEARITSALKANMVFVNQPDCVDAKCLVNRQTNIESTSTLDLIVRVRPFGYSEFIDVNIGLALNVNA